MQTRVLFTLLASGLLSAPGCSKPPPAAAPVMPAKTPADPPVTASPQNESAGPATQMPLVRTASGHIVVPVVIKDKTYSFLLDTGASMSVITIPTRKALALPDNAGQRVMAAGAGGEMVDIELVTLDHIEVAGRRYPQHSVAVMDLAHLETRMDRPVAGVLGRNFLSQIDLQVDFHRNIMSLTSPGTLASSAEKAWTKIPYSEIAVGLMQLDVALGAGTTVSAVFDMGAARSTLNQKAAAQLTGSSELAAGETRQVLGADGKPVQCTSRGPVSISLADLQLDVSIVDICDLPVFEVIGVSDRPAMLFGLDLLADRVLTIDFQNKQMYISGPSQAIP